MIYATAILGFVALVLLARWLLVRPLRFRDLTPQRLRELLQVLYLRGFDGATLVLEGARRRRVAVVHKRIVADDDVRLVCRWFGSPQLRAVLGEFLQQRQCEPVNLPDDAATGALMDVEMGRDRDLATRLILAVVSTVYGLDVPRTCVAYLTQIHPGNVRIGWSH